MPVRVSSSSSLPHRQRQYNNKVMEVDKQILLPLPGRNLHIGFIAFVHLIQQQYDVNLFEDSR